MIFSLSSIVPFFQESTKNHSSLYREVYHKIRYDLKENDCLKIRDAKQAFYLSGINIGALEDSTNCEPKYIILSNLTAVDLPELTKAEKDKYSKERFLYNNHMFDFYTENCRGEYCVRVYKASVD